jgi:hypothetical protein
MNQEQSTYDWMFGLQWLLACAAGVVLLGMAAFFSMWSIGEAVAGVWGETAGAVIAGVIFGTLFSLGASIGPGLLLQGKGVPARKWVAYSVFGGAIGGGLLFTVIAASQIAEDMPEALSGLVLGLLFGGLVGFGQWLALRETAVPADAWLVISPMAFIAAFSIGLPLGGEGREWLSIAAVSLILSALTAAGMVWLQGKTTAVAV